ncbi:histidine kinase [Actinoplanes sp. SE50]|uniref:ATP-binding protein n=1 Tax=unclassified Actinoplanes TaxID=2626549 RepID=UPI00023EBCF3|nr:MULTISPECIES: ATP-binding protein [unclassified Actinoplanes]AEV82909.1 putative histidine kinase, classic [Actinoplanes sp. SE50/110]ATO81305.1 histidine kinase [Actinoplanes sp. SE50]SLL98712.1 histidine kinase [Actinoplanes sp. SE50/110]
MNLRMLPSTVRFALLYLVAVGAGQLSVLGMPGALPVVWPATAVAAVWLISRTDPVRRWADAGVLFGLTTLALAAAGADLRVALVHGLSAMIEALIFAGAAARWLPGLWAPVAERGGARPMTTLRDLLRVLIMAVFAGLAGAAIGGLGEQFLTHDYAPTSIAMWLVRDVVSVLLFGAAARRLADLRLDRDAWPETVIVCALSAGAYFYVFSVNETLPIGFALMAITVWVALRLPTVLVIGHVMLFGTTAAVFTLHGHGPYALMRTTDPGVPGLIVQLYIAVLALVGLALAFSRDERTALIERLRASEHEATEKAGLMTTIVNSMTEGLAILDQTGHLVLRNPAAGRLLGSTSQVTAGSALGSDYGFFHPDGAPLADAELPYQRALAGEDVQPMDVLIRNAAVPEGRIVRFNVARLAGSGGPQHVVVVFHDVTADRRHRDELMSFAGVVAHDLLNPLTTIEGWAEVLEAELAGYKPAERVSRIQRAAARMRTFLNGLLAYTAARDGKLMPTTINLQLLLTDIANSRYDQAESNGTTPPQFAFGPLDAVEADPVLTRQLLENLIDHALETAMPGVPPQIGVSAQPAPNGMLRIDILDNGRGIPAGLSQAVFTNFHRGEGTGGSGLELAVCKRIVERHGGTIEAIPNPYGSGTRMTFTLPAGRSAYARTLENQWQQTQSPRAQQPGATALHPR